MSAAKSNSPFRSTHWSVIARASARDSETRQQALGELCESYWPPVYAFLRMRGLDPGEAEDATQEFFVDLVDDSPLLEQADPSIGRFRCFVLAALKNKLANLSRHSRAIKRGGNLRKLSIDRLDAESQFARLPVDEMTAEQVFQRKWAMSVLESVLKQLADRYASVGRREWFEHLRVYLVAGDTPPYEHLARELDSTAAAVRVAVCRLRKQYRSMLFDELESIMEPGGNLEQEREELLRALGPAS